MGAARGTHEMSFQVNLPEGGEGAGERRAEELAVSIHRRLVRRRPVGDLRVLGARCEQTADALDAFLHEHSVRAGTAARAVFDEVRRSSTELRLAAGTASEPFRLFVVGPGKAGKSSTVNALIGSTVAKVDVIPCTWRIDVYAPAGPTCQLIDADGRTLTGTADQIRERVARDEERRRASEARVRARLKEELVGLDPAAKKELQTKVQREELYASPYLEARWHLAHHPELEDIWVVDTPGLNQTGPMGAGGTGRSEAVDRMAREYYAKADGVLWILDATTVAAADSGNALHQVEEAFDSLGGRRENVVGVLNRMDLVRASGGDRDVRRVLDDCRARFGRRFVELVELSAYLARPGASAQELEASGIRRLREVIDGVFRKNAGRLRSQARQQSVRLAEACACSALRDYRCVLEDADADRRARIEAIDVGLRQTLADCYRQAQEWKQQTYQRIQESLRARLLDVYGLEGDQRARFFRDNVLMLDRLSREHDELVQSVQWRIERAADALSTIATFPEFQHLVVPHERVQFSVANPGLRLHELQVSAPAGGLLSVLAQLWERATQGEQRRVLASVESELGTAIRTLTERHVATSVHLLSESLKRRLEESFAAVHIPSQSVSAVSAMAEHTARRKEQSFDLASAGGLLMDRKDCLHVTTRRLFRGHE